MRADCCISTNMVDLIASEYEWVCPECGSLNNEFEVPKIVKCLKCGNEFETGTPEHCYE